MHNRKTGWIRLAIALTVLWAAAVSGLAAYEWFFFPASSNFVIAVIAKTGVPAAVLGHNVFADLIPTAPQFKLGTFLPALLIPVGVIWLLGGSWLWVATGFSRSEP